MPEQIIIVDENDKIIGHKERTTEGPEDIYRVSALMVVNSKNQILLAQRGLYKSHNPGEWSASAAGTVEEGETYLENMIKETREELGIDLNSYSKEEFAEIEKLRINGRYNFFCQWYLLKADIEVMNIIFPKSETEAVAWFDINYLEQDLQSCSKKYSKGLSQYLEMIKKYIK